MTILRPTGRFRGAEVIDAGREHLEPEELKRFFETLPAALGTRAAFWNAYFRLQYYFGCRISEPAVIFREDVSLSTKQIIVRRLKKRQFGSKLVEEGGKKRRVKDETNKVGDGYAEKVYSMPPALVKLLTEHMKATDEGKTKGNPWLFPSPRKPRAASNRLSLMRRVDEHTAVSRHTAEGAFVEAATAAQLPEGLRHSHVLRHTRATLMLAEGAREEDVKELLGHSSIATTRRYLGLAQALRLRLATTAQLGTGEGW